MKKISKALLLSFTILPLFLFSCASSDKEEVQETAIAVDSSAISVQEEKTFSAADTRTTVDKVFNLGKYEKVGESSLFVKSTLGKATQRTAFTIYKPGSSLAGFLARYDTSKYAIYFSASERAALIKAINQYHQDFENRQLDKSQKKTLALKKYGVNSAYEEYGVAAIITTGFGKPKVDMGYAFIGKSPYFCLSVNSTENLSDYIDSDVEKNIISQRYYFTLAQSQALADFLNEENLVSLMEKYNQSLVTEQAADVYSQESTGPGDSY